MTREEATIQSLMGHIKTLEETIKELKQEQKVAHWIKMPIGFKCSKCNELEDKTSKCCPNCGARMIEVKGESEC